MKEYTSTLCTFRKISEFESDAASGININYQYNIPIYQRLFVWEHEQVRNLLDDLFHAYKKDIPIYYIGAVVVAARNEKYELIDGQQRFTAVWLIAAVISYLDRKGVTNHLEKFAFIDESKLRLSFSIREGVSDFFSQLRNKREYDGNTIVKDVDNISEAFTQIKSYFEDYFETEKIGPESEHIILTGLSKYFYQQVKFNFIQVPDNSNLNKLFEVINSRGVQLAQYEILKANFKKYLPDNIRYLQLWNACSDMNDYIEQNIKFQAGLTWDELLKLMPDQKETFEVEEGESDSYAFSDDFFSEFCNMKTDEEDKPIDLLSILNNNEVITEEEKGKNAKREIESIISFNLLLLHVLRIFLAEHGEADVTELDERNLLQTFNTDFFGRFNEEKLKENSPLFIKKLVDTRIVFDQFIIKKVAGEDGTYHQIRRMKKNIRDGKYYPQRTKLAKQEDFAMLQSMVFHSQTKPHYWLTPYLYWLTNGGDEQLPLIRKIDNYFFCSKPGLKYQVIGWEFMKKIPDLGATDFADYIKGLEISDCTDYRHYGNYSFYKTEYILWHFRKDYIFIAHDAVFTQSFKELWNDYKFTFKNSVEHIYPQSSPEGGDALAPELLHDFGNLVLITTGINSSYGKLPVSVKSSKFDVKLYSKKIDSLKSFMIFKLLDWSKSSDKSIVEMNIKLHKEEIIRYVKKYFNYPQ
jgi:hypothetical protein